ncbi:MULTISPECIES: hypothetical protein [unclassified Streptomyces]|uniref:hypothetical protein n=1 Tax=unclassified Streptomyces TaxID=2593676 RepID=UPI0029A1A34C|nr:hypothetical protein [Streptomyces sp. PA03-2a]MDX2731015.1 hypothetical protein [Streptomyces sp. PA03-2a]
MALRGSATRRTTASPLTGVLRDLDRRTRMLQYGKGRRGAEGLPGVEGPRGKTGPTGPPGGPPAVTIVVTGEDGRALWALAEPLPGQPVVTALPVDQGETPALLTTVIEEATPLRVAVRMWLWSAGEAVPAGGIAVHLTATPRPDSLG